MPKVPEPLGMRPNISVFKTLPRCSDACPGLKTFLGNAVTTWQLSLGLLTLLHGFQYWPKSDPLADKSNHALLCLNIFMAPFPYRLQTKWSSSWFHSSHFYPNCPISCSVYFYIKMFAVFLWIKFSRLRQSLFCFLGLECLEDSSLF